MFLWLKTGFEHITDVYGYDHILFILVLCGIYALSDWKKVLILVTAFTVGHSISLFLSVLGIVSIAGEWVEFLIPISILLTAICNVLLPQENKSNMTLHYLLAVGFGLIHGLGFSNYLKALLGSEESILMPLISFNIGLELGQLLVLVCVFAIHYILEKFFKVSPKSWAYFINFSVIGISFIMTLERIPF